MSNKSPAFQWYPRDILSSARVQQMTLAEEGAYRRLLDYCWLNGSIPADPVKCARLIGKGATPEMAKVVLEMFLSDPKDPSQMIHDRLEAEREKQERNSEARRLASEARWNKRGKPADASGKRVKSKPDANALQMHSIASSTSSAIAEHSLTTFESERTHAPPAYPDWLLENRAVQMVWERFRPEQAIPVLLQERVATAVQDLERWKGVLDYWQENGYRPESYGKMVDTYIERGRKPVGERNGKQQKIVGNAAPKPGKYANRR